MNQSKTNSRANKRKNTEGYIAKTSIAAPIKQNRNTVSSGIDGLNSILNGGYTRERTTLIRGASGTGKTLFSLMFAGNNSSHKATVFASFDEAVENLSHYRDSLPDGGKITLLDFTPNTADSVSGTQVVDLAGVLVRIEHAIHRTGAKYLVMDAFDSLFDRFHDNARIHTELLKVFNWCREQQVTLLATAGTNANYEASTHVMDYASDCTILLRQDVDGGLMTRKLRVLKLRGRAHGTNEYPFLIDEQGISVLPVTEMSSKGRAYRKRLRTGVDELDNMLGGRGIWVGSTMMISGQSGTGKSLFSANLAEKACEAGHRVLYTAYEESPAQLIRDLKSAGIDLKPHVDGQACRIFSLRAVERGLEQHILLLLRAIKENKPNILILDPISALRDLGDDRTFKNMVLRLCHAIKEQGITIVLTELLSDNSNNHSDMNISSIVDTWIRLSRCETDGRLQRLIEVQKSRGAATSDQISEFTISRSGIEITQSVLSRQ